MAPMIAEMEAPTPLLVCSFAILLGAMVSHAIIINLPRFK